MLRKRMVQTNSKGPVTWRTLIFGLAVPVRKSLFFRDWELKESIR